MQKVPAAELDLAGRALAGIKRIHPVHCPKQCRLAATRRTDECRDATGGNIQVDVLQRMEFSVKEIQVPDRYLDRDGCGIRVGRLGASGDSFEVHLKAPDFTWPPSA